MGIAISMDVDLIPSTDEAKVLAHRILEVLASQVPDATVDVWDGATRIRYGLLGGGLAEIPVDLIDSGHGPTETKPEGDQASGPV